MKKLFLLVGLIFLLNSCAPYESTPKSYNEYKTSRIQQGFKYFAEARSYSNYKNLKHGHIGAHVNSQKEANQVALDGCNKDYSKDDCFLYNEGDKFVWEKNTAHLKAKEEEEKKNKELAEKKKKEEATLAALNLKKETCRTMGFTDETEAMANCILQLTLQESQSNTIVTNSSSDSGMVDAMNDQTRIMERQLRIQRQQNIRESTKRSQCIFNNLNDWYNKC